MTYASLISSPAASYLTQARRALPALIALALIVPTAAAWYLILDLAISALR
jgi:hypothetical protein